MDRNKRRVNYVTGATRTGAYGMSNPKKKKKAAGLNLKMIAGLALSAALVIAVIAYSLMGTGRTAVGKATRIGATLSQNVAPFGDSVIFYDGTTLHCVAATGGNEWSYQIGTNADYDATEDRIVAWSGNDLYIMNSRGRLIYNDKMSDVIQFASAGRDYVAAFIGEPDNGIITVINSNGQIVDNSTGLVETLEAVKEEYDAALAAGKPVGIACAMKNAGVGVGIPDWGRCKLIIEEDCKVHIYTGASCIGQGLGTVLVQMIVSNTTLTRDDIVYERSNTWIAPDSGVTSGSRQTMVTGEACRRACLKLHEAMAGNTLKDMIGQEFYGEYLAKTDPLGANVPNPVSHVAYGYATQMCILNQRTGLIDTIVAAHDVGKAINPLSCEGQIEGGVVMSMGYALTEQYPIDRNCKPIEKYGELGLFRAHQIPPRIKAIVIDKPGLNVACGAIGIGEITSIPTAPAIADAYFRLDGERRCSLPLAGTPYAHK